ncbi:hypothetical protein EW145_g1826 [Phellinidium pouzarii]|uniref:Cytochrome P450 n=1 Tax=Phellinidium pouzarii TaxID=167371 RepID=A0A4S4LDI8_9AGAM|nr:hypothetical protein EW145_g1826 [Phellinidium pouzarii]
MAFVSLALAAGATVAAYGAWKVIRWFISISPLYSHLHYLQGPKSSSFIYGNLEEIRKAGTSELHEEWSVKYGKVMKYKAFFGESRLFTMDTKALNHILTHSVDFQKPAQARFNLSRLLGDGILVTEEARYGEIYCGICVFSSRLTRCTISKNPSFGPSSIKELTPVFFQKALQLRDIWKSEVEAGQGSKTIEVLSWLSRTTLDIIGLAGFDYKFDALNVNQEPNELNKAFATLLNATGMRSPIRLLQAFFPIFRLIPTERGRDEHLAQTTMRRIAEGLLRQRKSYILGDSSAEKKTSDFEGRDLLSALVKSNMDTELPDTQRMVDEDVLAQVPTFLVAGHETTSTETMWCLFALSQRPDIQTKLRTELLDVSTDTPSMDELSALPYLDIVVRETMRLHAAVPNTIRIAMHDDTIPVGEPFVDKYGKTHTEIKVGKGDGIFIPILALNRTKAIWGDDAAEFNPDRWANIPEGAKDVPGVWGNMMTFLGGARSCIGYRFAIIEMKALLFTLLRTFEFELAVPVEDIERRSLVVTRPYLKGQKGGAQMQLKVKLHDKNA